MQQSFSFQMVGAKVFADMKIKWKKCQKLLPSNASFIMFLSFKKQIISFHLHTYFVTMDDLDHNFLNPVSIQRIPFSSVIFNLKEFSMQPVPLGLIVNV